MNSSQDTSQTLVSRNAPCPCGSGKKFKHCCLKKTPEKRPKRTLQVVMVVAAIGILAGMVAISSGFRNERNESGSPASVPQGSGTRQTIPAPANPASEIPAPANPAPWEYDAANNRHWDPSHGHWHNGPPPQTAPPQGSGTRQAPETATPAPYEYDAANNRHWDPTHAHWHEGPPPATTTPAEGSSTQ